MRITLDFETTAPRWTGTLSVRGVPAATSRFESRLDLLRLLEEVVEPHATPVNEPSRRATE